MHSDASAAPATSTAGTTLSGLSDTTTTTPSGVSDNTKDNSIHIETEDNIHEGDILSYITDENNFKNSKSKTVS